MKEYLHRSDSDFNKTSFLINFRLIAATTDKFVVSLLILALLFTCQTFSLLSLHLFNLVHVWQVALPRSPFLAANAIVSIYIARIDVYKAIHQNYDMDSDQIYWAKFIFSRSRFFPIFSSLRCVSRKSSSVGLACETLCYPFEEPTMV